MRSAHRLSRRRASRLPVPLLAPTGSARTRGRKHVTRHAASDAHEHGNKRVNASSDPEKEASFSQEIMVGCGSFPQYIRAGVPSTKGFLVLGGVCASVCLCACVRSCVRLCVSESAGLQELFAEINKISGGENLSHPVYPTQQNCIDASTPAGRSALSSDGLFSLFRRWAQSTCACRSR